MGIPAPKLDAMPGERRRVSRLNTVLAGQIVFEDGRQAVVCVVQNCSIAGALLRSATVITPPSSFGLAIRDVGRPLPCRVVWQRGVDIGVRFELGLPSRSTDPLPPNAQADTPAGGSAAGSSGEVLTSA